MNFHLSAAVSIGLLAVVWTAVSHHIGGYLITWVAFFSWASFFAVGGKGKGFIEGGLSNLIGAG
ncbi:hypothetical protein RsTz2092_06220 [Deferribacterales bacterium RsTz2092]|nr:hypothetical protein AGMMS49941_12760 [Deferribacterales bacterium]